MSNLTEYNSFLRALRLRHFKPVEITSYARRKRGSATNGLPPGNLWLNIVPTLWVLDQLREETGDPITLTSIYRNEEYNRAVGGVSNSQHKQNAAIDFQCKTMSPKQAFNRLKKMRDAGTFRGGLGVYATFVHLDTRGTNHTW